MTSARPLRAVAGWLLAPMPEARVAVLRAIAYLFVPLDVLVLHTSGTYHRVVDPAFYEPLLVARVLPLPVPTESVVLVATYGVVVAALLAATGRAPRPLGWTVFVLYLQVQLVAFSYGKVDHDRMGFLVALAVLPTVGRARFRSTATSAAAGWALRCVQLAAIATYTLAALAKLRFGGPEWVDSATLTRAVLRRGTALSDPLLEMPWTLHATQWVILLFELAAPLVFVVTERWRRRVVGFFFAFHAATYAMITIAFWPHLVCLLAFLPLERLAQGRRRKPGRSAAGSAQAGVPPGSRDRLAATSR